MLNPYLASSISKLKKDETIKWAERFGIGPQITVDEIRSELFRIPRERLPKAALDLMPETPHVSAPTCTRCDFLMVIRRMPDRTAPIGSHRLRHRARATCWSLGIWLECSWNFRIATVPGTCQTVWPTT